MALDRYRPIPVIANSAAGKTAVWRHDVDFSPQAAVKIAIIEAERGVAATYYFNLRSSFYNLFESKTMLAVSAIAAMGHEIGLHFDGSAHSVDSVQRLEVALTAESDTFASLLGLRLRSFSFHNPGPLVRDFQAPMYAGLVNAYGSSVMNGRAYCSDSNGVWRYDDLQTFLMKDYERICVLTHPGWWQESQLAPRERIVRCVEGRARRTLEEYDELLARHGRPNVR